MPFEAADNGKWLDWAVAGRTLAGETESGDRHLVAPQPNGVLVAVVDGLGHGPEAAAASREAVAALQEYASPALTMVVARCHDRLRPTRGVVMSLAWINPIEQSMTWIGVGDVDGVRLGTGHDARRRRECLLARGGVVGYQMPPLRASQIDVRPGDLLLFATDGIRSGFSEGLDVNAPPRQLADEILARYGKQTDDALVLVARYAGETNPGSAGRGGADRANEGPGGIG